MLSNSATPKASLLDRRTSSLPPFVSVKESENENEKPKIDHLSKKKIVKKSAIKKSITSFRFAGK